MFFNYPAIHKAFLPPILWFPITKHIWSTEDEQHSTRSVFTYGKAGFSMEFAQYKPVPSNVQEQLISKYKEDQAKGKKG